MMAKGKGTGRNNNYYWRNKIKNERQQPKARLRGKIRSKGESRLRSKSNPPTKGQKWVNKIKRERGIQPKTLVKKAPTPAFKKSVNRVTPNTSFKAKRTPAVKSITARKATPIKNRITPSKFVSPPVTTKREVNLLKKRQAVVKAPKSNKAIQNKIVGVAKLKSAALKTKPVSPSVKSGKVPSKGAMLLKKSASKIANQPRNVKRVKQPVIRRGR